MPAPLPGSQRQPFRPWLWSLHGFLLLPTGCRLRSKSLRPRNRRDTHRRQPCTAESGWLYLWRPGGTDGARTPLCQQRPAERPCRLPGDGTSDCVRRLADTRFPGRWVVAADSVVRRRAEDRRLSTARRNAARVGVLGGSELPDVPAGRPLVRIARRPRRSPQCWRCCLFRGRTVIPKSSSTRWPFWRCGAISSPPGWGASLPSPPRRPLHVCFESTMGWSSPRRAVMTLAAIHARQPRIALRQNLMFAGWLLLFAMPQTLYVIWSVGLRRYAESILTFGAYANATRESWPSVFLSLQEGVLTEANAAVWLFCVFVAIVAIALVRAAIDAFRAWSRGREPTHETLQNPRRRRDVGVDAADACPRPVLHSSCGDRPTRRDSRRVGGDQVAGARPASSHPVVDAGDARGCHCHRTLLPNARGAILYGLGRCVREPPSNRRC